VELAIALVGQASKRGIIPRTPESTAFLEEAAAWVRGEHPEVVRSSRVTSATTGAGREGGGKADGRAAAMTELRLSLHPAARDVVVTADERGRLTARAVTTPVGPGYHTFVGRLFQRLGEELGIAWAGSDGPGPSSDPTGFVATGDRRDAERGHLGWLGAELVRARESRRSGMPTVHLGTPPGIRFQVDAALATPMGPHDDAWLEQAAADPRLAATVWPWFTDAFDAQNRLSRAICLMWTEIRWRRPADEAERKTIEETLRLLRRAYPMDPSLTFPWREWLELAGLAGGGDPMAALLEERARTIDPATPLIGYRRRPVTVIHEGWALTVPGGYSERRSTDEWSGGEGGRSVTLAAVRTGADGRPMPPESFLRQVAGHLGSDALEHRAGEVLGRARIGAADANGISLGVVEGYAATTGSGAAIRVEFDDPSDWQWALDQWRSLRPA
jgi:hypothetical protein